MKSAAIATLIGIIFCMQQITIAIKEVERRGDKTAPQPRFTFISNDVNLEHNGPWWGDIMRKVTSHRQTRMDLPKRRTRSKQVHPNKRQERPKQYKSDWFQQMENNFLKRNSPYIHTHSIHKEPLYYKPNWLTFQRRNGPDIFEEMREMSKMQPLKLVPKEKTEKIKHIRNSYTNYFEKPLPQILQHNQQIIPKQRSHFGPPKLEDIMENENTIFNEYHQPENEYNFYHNSETNPPKNLYRKARLNNFNESPIFQGTGILISKTNRLNDEYPFNTAPVNSNNYNPGKHESANTAYSDTHNPSQYESRNNAYSENHNQNQFESAQAAYSENHNPSHYESANTLYSDNHNQNQHESAKSTYSDNLNPGEHESANTEYLDNHSPKQHEFANSAYLDNHNPRQGESANTISTTNPTMKTIPWPNIMKSPLLKDAGKASTEGNIVAEKSDFAKTRKEPRYISAQQKPIRNFPFNFVGKLIGMFPERARTTTPKPENYKVAESVQNPRVHIFNQQHTSQNKNHARMPSRHQQLKPFPQSPQNLHGPNLFPPVIPPTSITQHIQHFRNMLRQKDLPNKRHLTTNANHEKNRFTAMGHQNIQTGMFHLNSPLNPNFNSNNFQQLKPIPISQNINSQQNSHGLTQPTLAHNSVTKIRRQTVPSPTHRGLSPATKSSKKNSIISGITKTPNLSFNTNKQIQSLDNNLNPKQTIPYNGPKLIMFTADDAIVSKGVIPKVIKANPIGTRVNYMPLEKHQNRQASNKQETYRKRRVNSNKQETYTKRRVNSNKQETYRKRRVNNTRQKMSNTESQNATNTESFHLNKLNKVNDNKFQSVNPQDKREQAIELMADITSPPSKLTKNEEATENFNNKFEYQKIMKAKPLSTNEILSKLPHYTFPIQDNLKRNNRSKNAMSSEIKKPTEEFPKNQLSNFENPIKSINPLSFSSFLNWDFTLKNQNRSSDIYAEESKQFLTRIKKDNGTLIPRYTRPILSLLQKGDAKENLKNKFTNEDRIPMKQSSNTDKFDFQPSNTKFASSETNTNQSSLIRKNEKNNPKNNTDKENKWKHRSRNLQRLKNTSEIPNVTTENRQKRIWERQRPIKHLTLDRLKFKMPRRNNESQIPNKTVTPIQLTKNNKNTPSKLRLRRPSFIKRQKIERISTTPTIKEVLQETTLPPSTTTEMNVDNETLKPRRPWSSSKMPSNTSFLKTKEKDVNSFQPENKSLNRKPVESVLLQDTSPVKKIFKPIFKFPKYGKREKHVINELKVDTLNVPDNTPKIVENIQPFGLLTNNNVFNSASYSNVMVMS